jgi:acyl-CoA thioesterase
MVFLDGAELGEVLVAEAQEQALVVRSGVYNVSVRTDAGRPVAEFQGFSRSIGGPYIATGDEV